MGYPVVFGGGAPPVRPRSVTVASILLFVIAGLMVATAASAQISPPRTASGVSAMAVTTTAGVYSAILAVLVVFMGYYIRRGQRGWRTTALVLGWIFIGSGVLNTLLLGLLNSRVRDILFANGVSITRYVFNVAAIGLWAAVVVLLLRKSSTGFFPLPVRHTRSQSRLPEDHPAAD